ncbi:MAG TPA: TolC family outer membrane protein [Burkholderiales bacterium]|nr:TolC family outer membrane protein [Burkholderiales bacterium]
MRLKALAWLVFGVASGHAAADDLMAVYREGLQSDPVFAAARSSYEASKEKLPQGRALFLPNVNVTANGNYNWANYRYFNGTTSLPPGSQEWPAWGVGLNITQPLLHLQNNAVYDQAGMLVAQAESQLALAGQDLMIRVAQGYFDVLLAEYELETVKAQKAATAEQLAQAKRNFQVGTATITDTYDAQARYDLVVAQEITDTNDIQVKREALRQIIGRLPGPLARPNPQITLSAPEPNDMDAWVQAAYSNSLQVKIAKDNLDIAAKEIDRNRAAHYPTIDAVGSASYNSQNSSQFAAGQNISQSLIGLQLNYPLYQGGSITSKVREAIANNSKAAQDYENARRTVAQSVRQAFLAVSTGLAEIGALRQAVASNQLSVDATKLGQEVGVRTEVDVLNSQQLLYSAQRDLYRAYYVTIVGQLKLKQAVGNLTPVDLDNVNRLLKPN